MNRKVQQMNAAKAAEKTVAPMPRFAGHRPFAIQTKLRVGAPADRYEQEADRIADRFMRTPGPACSAPERPRPARPAGVQRACKKCEEEVRRKPLYPLLPDSLQREARDGPGQEFYNGTRAVVPAGGGQPLPESIRTVLEPRLGHDLSEVRIHVDTRANRAAAAMQARAFTLGYDVVFGAEQYAPGTSEGRWLLAHELVHVIQQGRAEPRPDTASSSASDAVSVSRIGSASVLQKVGECTGRNGYNCNGVRCTTLAGRRGMCNWGGRRFGCNCRDQSGDAPAPSRARELLPSWVLLVLSAAALAVIAACFATGVCEAGIIIGAAGAAVAAVVIGILQASGVNVVGADDNNIA